LTDFVFLIGLGPNGQTNRGIIKRDLVDKAR